MWVRRIGLLIAVTAFVGLHAVAQQTSAPTSLPPQTSAAPENSTQPVTTIHATARLVVLDVVVSDGHGHPVIGLQPSNFALTEDGVTQILSSFTEHDAATSSTPSEQASEPQLPPNTFAVHPPVTGNGSLTAIVISVGFTQAPFVRSQLKEYLKTSTLSTPIAIFRLDWQGMHLVQGFTANREVLLEAANSKRMLPPLGFPMPSVVVTGSPTKHLASYLSGIPGRMNVVWISDGGAPGGEMATEFPDIASFVQDLNGITDVLRLSRVALYPIDANGVVVPTGDQANFGFNLVPNISATNASFVDWGAGTNNLPQLFSTSPNPQLFSLQTSSMFSNPNTMFAHADLADMAAKTGGNAFFNTNGFKQAIANVVATGAHYYTISYRPTNPNWNGDFRNIKIDVTGIPETKSTQSLFSRFLGWSDAEQPKVLYRSGYYARTKPPTPNPNSAASPPVVASNNVPAPQRKLLSVSPRGDPGQGAPAANPTRMQSAMAFGTVTPFRVHFTVVVTPSPEIEKTKPGDLLPSGNFLIGAFRDGPYRNYGIHYWIDPKDIQFRSTASGKYHDDLQLVTVLYRDDGLPANSAASTMHLDIAPEDLDQVQLAGISFDQTIAMPAKGNFFVRTGVHEISSGRIGALEVPAEWIKPLPLPNPSLAQRTP